MESTQLSTDRDDTFSDLKKLMAERHRSWFLEESAAMVDGFDECRKHMDEIKGMLLQLLKSQITTPLWISELSTMSDEVRDWTILIKFHSEMHPINDLVIYHLFSEIGVVEDVRYSPTESGFHSRVRFQNKYSSDWAFHHYNGRNLHERCCQLEIHRAKDILCWNSHRFDRLSEEISKYASVEKHGQEPDQRDSKSDWILADELPSKFAHQALEEMPEPTVDNQIVAAKTIDLAAYQVLDEMPALVENKKELDFNISQVNTAVKHGVSRLLKVEGPQLIVDVSHKMTEKSSMGAPRMNVAMLERLQQLDLVLIYDEKEQFMGSDKLSHLSFDVMTFDPGGGELQGIQEKLPDMEPLFASWPYVIGVATFSAHFLCSWIYYSCYTVSF